MYKGSNNTTYIEYEDMDITNVFAVFGLGEDREDYFTDVHIFVTGLMSIYFLGLTPDFDLERVIRNHDWTKETENIRLSVRIFCHRYFNKEVM